MNSDRAYKGKQRQLRVNATRVPGGVEVVQGCFSERVMLTRQMMERVFLGQGTVWAQVWKGKS